MSFADLKRNSKNNFDKLSKELSKLNTPSKQDDENVWKLTVDKLGNGSAIIRFLPAPDGEDFPYVKIFDHGFQGPGGWYIEKSLRTVGQPDPCGEYNSKLWNSGVDADKEQARKQKQRTAIWSNIYVVKDPANPENEGKVFKYRYGKKIFEKLNEAMNPADDPLDPKEPMNPFDLWEGANFRLKQRKVEGWPNYDKSEFDSPAPLDDDDDKLEEIYNQCHSLQELVDPKNFKTYDELQQRLHRVLGITDSTGETRSAMREPEPETPVREHRSSEPKEEAETPWNNSDDDDEDDLDFFKRIAEED